MDTNTGSGTIVGRRDVTQTASDLQQLSYLVVMRNGNEQIASITQLTPATALADLDKLEVKGNIAGTAGFLELTWKYPSDDHEGEYTCEANGLSTTGHSLVLSTTTEVGTKPPQPADLVQYIHTLQQELAESRHVETGTIDCGPSTGWTSHMAGLPGEPHTGEDHIYIGKNVTFQHAYSTPPAVHLSIQHIDSRSDAYNYYFIDLVSVDNGQFAMRCRTTRRDRISDMHVRWMSVPR